jgi:phospholipase/carboxylesterase|tara:strand:- start:968 stop:1624 length:657 start_codon:yes stop_codon:yes gene_type:complete
MDYSLNTTVVNFQKSPRHIIILCHGYGGDGNDISLVANYWKNFLPNTLFLCPDAPEICKVNPDGFQWFDLMDQTEDEIFSKSLIAENKLNKFIDDVVQKYKISFNQVALVGFSQGCMISLQTALKRKKKINCLIGYSGKIINQAHLSKNIVSRPEIYLMHGDKDQVVPIGDFLSSKEFFFKNKYKIHTKIFEKCEHRIPTEGLSLGLEFLKKNLVNNY